VSAPHAPPRGDPASDAAATPEDDGRDGSPRWRPDSTLTLRDGASWWLLLGYAVVAVAVMARVLWHAGSDAPGPFGDSSGTDWWLAWALHWITHGGNLFHPDVLNAPEGMSALWNTSVLGLGIPAAPLTALFGPVATYNVLVAAGLALTAWVGALAAARWVSRPAAAVVGLLAGFGAAELGQAEAHLHLVWFAYPELLVLLGTDLVRGAPPRRIGLWIAAATCWQFFVSTEVLLSSTMFAAVMIAAALLVQPSFRRRLRTHLTAAGTTVVGAGIVLAYPLTEALRTPSRHFHTTPQFSADLANLVVPTSLQLVVPWKNTAVFGGNVAEGGLYLGLPLVLALAMTCWVHRHRPAVRALTATAVVMLLLSLGPRLHYAGYVSAVPLPWAALRRVLPLGNVLPGRLDAYVGICAALLAGFAVDLARKARWAHARAAGAVVIAAACLAAWLPRPAAPARVSVPAFFRTDDVDILPVGSLVRTVPRVTTSGRGKGDPLLWQADAAMRYRTTGVFWNGVLANGDAFEAITTVNEPVNFSPTQSRAACTVLRDTRTAAVLVLAGQSYSRTADDEVRRITHVAGSEEGGMVVFLLAGSPCGGS
jgi:hypothetical protein